MCMQSGTAASGCNCSWLLSVESGNSAEVKASQCFESKDFSCRILATELTWFSVALWYECRMILKDSFDKAFHHKVLII